MDNRQYMAMAGYICLARGLNSRIIAKIDEAARADDLQGVIDRANAYDTLVEALQEILGTVVTEANAFRIANIANTALQKVST